MLAAIFATGTAGVVGSLLAQQVAYLSQSEAYPAGPLPNDLKFDRLTLEKEKRLLTAWSNGIAVRRYLVALGLNPVGAKEFEGDYKTPEGQYIINERNANSAYYKNVGVSYPNEADRKRAAAMGRPPGGLIKIHGLAPTFAHIGALHRAYDWTHGCIAVDNQEMEEIFSRTKLGSPIVITP